MVRMLRRRYLDLIRRTALDNGKMAFVTGPRQVGKTTLARQFEPGGGEAAFIYYNWDDVAFRRAWAKDPKALVPQTVGRRPFVVFDELHKAPRWKRGLKGVFDMRGAEADIVVTGSARLDLFRRGGDSLLGRYFPFRLHPLSVGELRGEDPATPDTLAGRLNTRLPSESALLAQLLRFGGFPEPLLKAEPLFGNVWRRTRIDRLVREDLRDLTRAQEVALLETTAALLPTRVGSPVSVQSLAQDLEVSHPTMRRWLGWFGDLYVTFTVPPYTRRVTRSIRKRPKLYLWEWSEVEDEGARFENLVASHFLKAAHFWTDAGYGLFELRYVRDKEKREVDFLLLRDRKPWLLAECRLRDATPAASLRSFSAALSPPITLQIVGIPDVQERFDLTAKEKGTVISADRLLTVLA